MADWKLVLAGPWKVGQGGGGDDYRAKLVAQLAPISGTVEWTGT